jgi:hypothetical protein
MEENNKKQFRFLDTGEFRALPAREKMIYLTMASQEIEIRQRQLREQMKSADTKDQESKP